MRVTRMPFTPLRSVKATGALRVGRQFRPWVYKTKDNYVELRSDKTPHFAKGVNMKHIPIIIVAIVVAGCTSIQVTPLDSGVQNQVACIEENEKVIVPRFLEILVNGFEERNFTTRVYKDSSGKNCQLLVTYTATRNWDFTPYLSDAEVWIRDTSGNRLGYGQYHLKGGGGLAFTKWASAESKMEKVFDQLFTKY